MAVVFQPSPKPLLQPVHRTPLLNFVSPIISFPNTRHHYGSYNYLIPKIPSTSSSFRIRSRNDSSSTPPLPETECPVPADQQPINEYHNLSTSLPFSWVSGGLVEYCSRLSVTGASFALFIGLPVAWFGAVGPDSEPFKSILGAVSSGILFVTLAVVRMYLGWAYVGNRLLSATVEYEETGWYDGQVKPMLSRLKYTLITLGASLFVCALLLINLEGGQKISSLTPTEPAGRAIPGVYNDDSARSFEPDAFCGEPSLS